MKAKIKFAFRITVDENSTHIWDQYVFEDAFKEYRIQHHVYQTKNNPEMYYCELLSKNPNAKNIPFLIEASIQNYILQLNQEIKSLPDILGTTFFKFQNFKVDIINAHITDTSQFKIGITFYSDTILLIDIIDQKYLISENTDLSEEKFPTIMFPFHHQVSICEYEKI